MIKASNVSVSIGRREILSAVNFSAEPRKVTAVNGPNGSGQSTLTQALSGDLPYGGSITLNGYELARLRPGEAAEMRAVLPQAVTLSFPYTVREVVSLGIMGNYSGRETDAKLPELALAKVDLPGFSGRLYQ